MAKIKAIKAREILDSRGFPTVETTIWTDNDHGAIAAVPSGASTGSAEAVELRDNDTLRFNGRGVLKAVLNVNEIIAPRLIDRDPTHQNEIDQILLNLDGTANKSRLGANAILSVSQAVCELGAIVSNLQTFEYLVAKYSLKEPTPFNLPTPIFNVINGGKHGAGNLDFQEFHLIPSSRLAFSESLEIGETVYQNLKTILADKKAIHSVGDEGGFAPNLYTNQDALELIIEAIKNSRLTVNQQIFVGLDIAATNIFQGGKYKIKDRDEAFSPEEFVDFLITLKKKYSLFSLEDPLEENAWDNWSLLNTKIGRDTMIIGDDLVTTNKVRIKKAIDTKSINALIIKPNQIGTISETVSVIKMAKANNLSTIVSHRSGDTCDDFIADFAVGVGADFAKFGAPARGERIHKYNRLSLIESYLRSKQKS
jgi:enolase